MNRLMSRRTTRYALLVLIAALAWGTLGARETALPPTPPSTGAVYAMTNTTALNQIWAFTRASNGTLNFLGAFGTNGKGSGTSLNSQGAVVLQRTTTGELLFAVNAKSNEISAFTVSPTGLTLVGKVSSGGVQPVSLATPRVAHPNLLYVLNAGGTPNVTGFTISSTGMLQPLAGSTQTLSAASKPYKASFNGRGLLLVVTESGTSQIDTYGVTSAGLLHNMQVQNSNGPQPSGFALDLAGHLIVAEAQNSAVSSYSISAGLPTVISGSVVDGGQGACCVAVANGFAYAANTTSSTISGYAVGADGSLTLLSGSTPTGSDPVDLAVSNDNKFVYVLDGSLGRVVGYQIQSDGSLMQVTEMNGLPPSAYGLAGN